MGYLTVLALGLAFGAGLIVGFSFGVVGTLSMIDLERPVYSGPEEDLGDHTRGRTWEDRW